MTPASVCSSAFLMIMKRTGLSSQSIQRQET
jgi:hypothetical protein